MRHVTSFILLFFLTCFISCNNKSENSKAYSLKDTVARKHLQWLDSANYPDTTDINYKVLKAYLSNDTFFFKKLSTDIEKEREFRQQWEANDSCIHQPSLEDLNADEAYRFIYAAAFCEYKLNVTVSNRGNNANIHFIILQDAWLNSTCKIINEFDKEITAKEWDNFSQLMAKADFWGLKSTNDVAGLDGSTLITTGFKKGYNTFEGTAKFSYVYRWDYTTLSDPFQLALKLSGNTQGCLVIKSRK